MGISRTDLDRFCMDLGHEISWDILLLQEFSFTGDEFDFTEDGHRVFAQPPCAGQRRSAIILHAGVAHLAQRPSFQSKGRSCCLGLDWESWKLRLVCAHLCSGCSIQNYMHSLDDLESLCTVLSTDRYVIVGADAQDALGPASADDDSSILGDFAETGRGCKGELFLRFCLERRLKILNTFLEDPLGSYTCHYYLKHPPRQIDFMCTDLPSSADASCRLLQSEATVTDIGRSSQSSTVELPTRWYGRGLRGS